MVITNALCKHVVEWNHLQTAVSQHQTSSIEAYQLKLNHWIN